MTEPIRFRSPTLVAAILGYIYDDDHPTPWEELLETFAIAGRPWKTVENVIYDLVAFGALHRIGKPPTKGNPDTRALRPTALGRAWLDGRLVPLPGRDDLEEDPLEEAEEIARALGDDLELETYTLEPDPPDS